MLMRDGAAREQNSEDDLDLRHEVGTADRDRGNGLTFSGFVRVTLGFSGRSIGCFIIHASRGRSLGPRCEIVLSIGRARSRRLPSRCRTHTRRGRGTPRVHCT